MIASRWLSLSWPQAAISLSVRPQPMQSPLWPLTAQTLMHGVETVACSMAIIQPPAGLSASVAMFTLIDHR
jgi:hypothetical protein